MTAPRESLLLYLLLWFENPDRLDADVWIALDAWFDGLAAEKGMTRAEVESKMREVIAAQRENAAAFARLDGTSGGRLPDEEQHKLILAKWEELSLMPEHGRATRIGDALGVSGKHVREVLTRYGKRHKQPKQH